MMMCFTYYLCIWIQYCHFLVLGCYQLNILTSFRLNDFPCFVVLIFTILNVSVHQVLYHVLSTVPAYHPSVGPMLNELCLGLKSHELAQVVILQFVIELVLFHLVLCILTLFFFQALVGVYAKEVHVRLACLNAIKCVPIHSVQRDLKVSTSLWIAAHDPEKVCQHPYEI